MGYYVYILRCSDGSYYTGHTDQMEARLVAHQSGHFSGYTSERIPVELVFLEELNSRDEAFRRERQIKGWSRSKKEALMANDWEKLVLLSKSEPHESKLTSEQPRGSTGIGHTWTETRVVWDCGSTAPTHPPNVGGGTWGRLGNGRGCGTR